jgi:transcriptional regulator with XRE-family HTH domain
MNYDGIKKAAKAKKMSIKKLASLSDMTEAGLYQAMNNRTLKIETLEKIAKVLDVSVTSFFENKPGTEQLGQIHERRLPQPAEPELTGDIMALNVSDREKIAMLRERISSLELQLRLTQQILDAIKGENKKAKK